MQNKMEQELLVKYSIFTKDGPKRKEYGLGENDVVSFTHLQAMNKLINNGQAVEKNALELIKKESQYRNSQMQWHQYLEWKNNRNPKRAEMEKEFGFDGKHACHLVRLMRMGYEILSTGKVIVERPDAKELLSIRQGAWSYEKIIDFAAEMDAKMGELYEHPEKCAVKHTPDINYLNNLCVEIVQEYWKNK